MRALFLILFLLPVALQAQPLLPALMEVTGVAADDTLNVRAEPGGGSRDIGDLYDGERIEITALNDSGTWARIPWTESDGWISMRYLRPVNRPEDPDSGMPLDLTCSGTEPFWLAAFRPDRHLIIANLDGPDTVLTLEAITNSRNTYISTFAFKAGDYTGLLQRAECSDGMSETTYGWALDLIGYSDGNLDLTSGCCSVSAGSVGR